MLIEEIRPNGPNNPVHCFLLFNHNFILCVVLRNISNGYVVVVIFREVMDEYVGEVYRLWEVLMEALSRGLGLENENTLNKAVGGDGKEIHIRINYYPPCPQPDLVLGLSPHSDPNVVTFLLHDETPGLQIRKDGNWVDVQSVPGAFIVNVADALEVPRLAFEFSFSFILKLRISSYILFPKKIT